MIFELKQDLFTVLFANSLKNRIEFAYVAYKYYVMYSHGDI